MLHVVEMLMLGPQPWALQADVIRLYETYFSEAHFISTLEFDMICGRYNHKTLVFCGDSEGSARDGSMLFEYPLQLLFKYSLRCEIEPPTRNRAASPTRRWPEAWPICDAVRPIVAF